MKLFILFASIVVLSKVFGVRWFSCPKYDNFFDIEHGENVNELFPSDISIIAALGDSYTAANGAKAKTLPEVYNEDRGVSWSIGGEETIRTRLTLPNILKKFNKKLVGYSNGTGNYQSVNAIFNAARPGKEAPDLPAEAVDLVNKINEAYPDGHDDLWKLVTVLIGGNDLCSHCTNSSLYSADNYEANVVKALTHLRNNLKRVYVNLVSVTDTNVFKTFNDTVCVMVAKKICPCIFEPYDSSEVTRLAEEYNNRLEGISKDPLFNSDDFAVVYQPFLKLFKFPTNKDGTPDKSFFAPDCFHLSLKGHQSFAMSLWNNMVSPNSEKDIVLDETNICPDEDYPYLFTNENSEDEDYFDEEYYD